jgi:hypothetical protein
MCTTHFNIKGLFVLRSFPLIPTKNIGISLNINNRLALATETQSSLRRIDANAWKITRNLHLYLKVI